jgi:hypothetical protein
MGGSLEKLACTAFSPRITDCQLRQRDHPSTNLGPVKRERRVVEVLSDAATGAKVSKLFLRLER